MNTLKFIGKASLTYLVGRIVVGVPLHLLVKKLDKMEKAKEQPTFYTNVCGFEVEPGTVYEDDSDKGEFIVRGFTR